MRIRKLPLHWSITIVFALPAAALAVQDCELYKAGRLVLDVLYHPDGSRK